jgi:hypothetical protein
MNNLKLIIKILMPSILCILLIYITNMQLEYSTLFFGFFIGITNWDLHKYNLCLGILLSVLVSFVSFLIAYFSFAITGNIFNLIVSGDSGKVLGLNVSTNIIAPLLVFLLYRIVFNISKTRLTTFVIILSLVILVSQNYLYRYLDSLSINVLESKILNSYAIWQIIMALALQLILYQKEILVMLSPKNKSL